MIRGALLICPIVLIIALSAPNLGSAQEPESERSDGRSQQAKSEQPEGRQEWRARLLAANREVAIARERSATALRVYASMRHRRRPRGDARQAVMDELTLSREELAKAQQHLEKLEEAARRAGAPPSWLEFDPAEIEAATQFPASQQP